MICPKCGYENKANYCIKCGIMLTSDGIIQIKSDYKKDINDQLQKVLGDKADILISKPRNLAAGFFGPLYLIYRHCYLEGILLFILDCLLLFLSIPFLSYFTFLVLWIFHFPLYTIFTNTYYVWKIKKQLDKPIKSNIGQGSFVPVAIFVVTIYLFFILYTYLI